MKFFTKSRYALRVMIELARRSRMGNTPLKSIAQSQHISLKYLEQIIAPLSRAGLVRSERGSQGGYRLAMRTEMINLKFEEDDEIRFVVPGKTLGEVLKLLNS